MKKGVLTLLIMIGLISLAGCQENPMPPGGEETVTPPAVTHAAPSGTEVPDTPTTAPVELMTPVPTDTPVPTNTPMPTNTPAPTSTPTPTPMQVDLSLSEKIPVVYVETEGGQNVVSRDDYVNCVVSVFNVTAEHAKQQVKAGIRVRGNSSAYYGNEEKILANLVPYRIKFDKKTSMLGLNDGAECKSWVFLRTDEGLVRDDIAFRLGRAILGDRYYCSDGQLVHLYVNGDFKGPYLLCEQSQVNKHRIDITEVEKDYTGTDIGYLVEIDNNASSEHPYFKMYYQRATVTDIEGQTQKFGWANYSIKSDVYSDAQKKFINRHITNVFKIVYEACENGVYYALDENSELVTSSYDNSKDAIAAVMDLDSVVASYILEEIMDDRDCGEGSFYMCVDFSKESKYPKLTFVCPWDYDWTCYDNAEGRYYAGAFNKQSFVDKYGDRSNPWFIILMKQEWFREMVKERWAELQKEGALAAAIQYERDYIKEYKADLNRKKKIATDTGNAILNWLEKRIKWLDSQWAE